MPDGEAGDAWDAEYAAGRYLDEPPVAFVRDILAAARTAGATTGLYSLASGPSGKPSGAEPPDAPFGCSGRYSSQTVLPDTVT